jgi:hypothetical protein
MTHLRLYEKPKRGVHQTGSSSSFNGRLRDECLSEHLFANLNEARQIIEEWRIDYNTNRPHTSLNGLTPTEFAIRPTQGRTRTDSTYKRGHTGEQVIRNLFQPRSVPLLRQRVMTPDGWGVRVTPVG